MILASAAVFVTILFTPAGNFVAEAPMASMADCERLAKGSQKIITGGRYWINRSRADSTFNMNNPELKKNTLITYCTSRPD